MTVHVTSEIGPLREVLVHTPGPELLAVTPDTREDFLYDDIIDVEIARQEHGQFIALLQRFATVHFVRDLLTDLVGSVDLRAQLIRDTMDVVASEPLAAALAELPAEDFVTRLIEGSVATPGPLARTLNETGFDLPPLPNLFFTRDSAMTVGRHAMIGSMRFGIRWTEELIMKALFRFHPRLANDGVLYDGSAERRLNHTLEGGDVHILRADTVMIGFSERSSPAAIDRLVDLFFTRTAVENVIVVVMPKENTAIHLDMIFTMLDRGQCICHAPHFVGPERLATLLWRKGEATLREMPTVFAALAELALPLDPVLCGGPRRIMQEREQWASGCNFLAVRPGVVLSYARNHATLDAMSAAGFRVIAGDALLDGGDVLGEGDRAVITFESGELVRGGGGARCMSCPVVRDDAWS
ncbi:MAG TPA: arginine deiminase family protein [Gemmatimonadaceae bacterium]|nr:arginine deiminase family protein [Gemmatimonadaceae bacterium]